MRLSPGVRRLAVLLATLVGLEAASSLIIAVTNPKMISPITRRSAFYRTQSAAIQRYLAGDRAFWVFDSIVGWSTTGAARLGVRDHYTIVPARGVVRIAGLGNSFMRGADVPVADAWMEQLQARLPRIEFLNYGVAAYGTDQSYLQFLESPRARRATIVLIGLAPDNVRRNLNVWRPFLAARSPPMSKPRYRLTGDSLALLPNPVRDPAELRRYLEEPSLVRELGRDDAWYQASKFDNPLYDVSATVRLGTEVWQRVRDRVSANRLEAGGVANVRSEGFRLEMALLRRFIDRVEADGAYPMVVLLPDRQTVARALRSRPGFLQPFADSLRGEGVELLDLTVPLVEAVRGGAQFDRLFTPGLHYSAEGGTAIAAWLAKALGERLERPLHLVGPGKTPRPAPGPTGRRTAAARNGEGALPL